MFDLIVQIVMVMAPVALGGIGYLLRQKDADQQRQLEELQRQKDALWEKHDEDAERLQELELKIASEHYVKRELDGKFDKLESAITGGLNSLGERFDKLANAMTEHLHRKP